jgi:hypothetical protein
MGVERKVGNFLINGQILTTNAISNIIVRFLSMLELYEPFSDLIYGNDGKIGIHFASPEWKTCTRKKGSD